MEDAHRNLGNGKLILVLRLAVFNLIQALHVILKELQLLSQGH